MTASRPDSAARPRLGILSYSSGEYDARSFRIARSAIAAGYDVTIYTRWHPPLAQDPADLPAPADGLGRRARGGCRARRHLARDVGGIPPGAPPDAPPARRPDDLRQPGRLPAVA